MRSSLILAAAFSLAAGARGFAQTRPLATEEASTAAAGTVVLEAGASAISDEPNFLTGAARDRWEGPELRLVYSPAGNVELDVEWTVRVGVRDDPDFGDVSDFGDVALRAKVRMAGRPGGRDAIGLRFGVVLPQTSFGNGLGPNALRMSAQVLASKAVGGATVHLERRPRDPRRAAARPRAARLLRLWRRGDVAGRAGHAGGRSGRPRRQRIAGGRRAERGAARGAARCGAPARRRRGAARADGLGRASGGLPPA